MSPFQERCLTLPAESDFKAGNGEIIATFQMYDTKSGALNGIESVQKNAADATVDDQSDKPAE